MRYSILRKSYSEKSLSSRKIRFTELFTNLKEVQLLKVDTNI